MFLYIYFQCTQPSSGRTSPSLDDLEAKKRLLLEALNGNKSEAVSLCEVSLKEDVTETKSDKPENNEDRMDEETKCAKSIEEIAIDKDATENEEEKPNMVELLENASQANTSQGDAGSSLVNDLELPKTPSEISKGGVKTTQYGTPVLNIASPYVKLPSDNNFAKDICDVIYFENLPNSTGKYKKISNLLKKVKNEVDRIQGSWCRSPASPEAD